jgi:hypothetical protein
MYKITRNSGLCVKIEKIALKGIEPGGCVIITPVEFLWQISSLGKLKTLKSANKQTKPKHF